MCKKHNILDATRLRRPESPPLLGGTHGSKHETMFQPFVKRHAKANLQLQFGTCVTSHRKRLHTLGIFTVIGCVNQSVVNIRQFADASSSGSIPSSMEMAGSSKCRIHRRQRYKLSQAYVLTPDKNMRYIHGHSKNVVAWWVDKF